MRNDNEDLRRVCVICGSNAATIPARVGNDPGDRERFICEQCEAGDRVRVQAELIKRGQLAVVNLGKCGFAAVIETAPPASKTRIDHCLGIFLIYANDCVGGKVRVDGTKLTKAEMVETGHMIQAATATLAMIGMHFVAQSMGLQLTTIEKIMGSASEPTVGEDGPR